MFNKTFLLLKYQQLLTFLCFSQCFHMESPNNEASQEKHLVIEENDAVMYTEIKPIL